MSKEEMKDEAAAPAAEETVGASDRRTFMKSTLLAAATVAVGGGLTSSLAEASEAQEEKMAVRRATKLVNVRFPRAQPTLDDLQKLIAQAVGRYGCVACGLLGIDIRFGLGEIKVRRVTPVQLDAGVEVNAFEQKIGY